MTVTKVGCHTIVFKEDERKDLDLMLSGCRVRNAV